LMVRVKSIFVPHGTVGATVNANAVGSVAVAPAAMFG